MEEIFMQKITNERFLQFKFISQLKSDESESVAAFLTAKPNLEKNNYQYDLFYTDGTNKKRVLKLKETSGFIFETADSVIFPYTKTKKEEKEKKDFNAFYYRYTFSTEKLEKAYQFSAPFSIVSILEGQLLLQGSFAKEMHGLYQKQGEERKALIKEMKKNALYEDITDLPFYFNGTGFTSNMREQLFLYDIKTKTTKPLFDSNFNVETFKVSKDKKDLYVIGDVKQNTQSLYASIYKYDLKTGETQTMFKAGEYALSNLHLLDDLMIVEASDMKDFGINQDPLFYELKEGKLELFCEVFTSIGNSMGSDARLGGSSTYAYKDGLYFLSTTESKITLNKLSKNRSVEHLFTMEGSIDGFCFVNGKILLVGLNKQKLQEVYELNLTTKKLKPFTAFNRNTLSNYYIAKPKRLELKERTHTVEGFVLVPEDFDKKKTYPAILDIHGGPKTVYGKVYYHEMQVWANMGYIVFFANPRGSDGKGNEFADIRGKYGTIDYDDLMNFTDLVLKKYPQIDKKNMFVTGGSYGGFMTNWIVGQTNRFKAAATQRSISNWISFYGTSDIGFYFATDQTGGHPIVDTDKLWAQSPIKYAKQVKTPLLFIHSDQDYRCPIEQAMQFYAILKEQGLDTKLTWFYGENHDLSRAGKPQARLKRLNEITNWFETHKA